MSRKKGSKNKPKTTPKTDVSTLEMHERYRNNYIIPVDNIFGGLFIVFLNPPLIDKPFIHWK